MANKIDKILDGATDALSGLATDGTLRAIVRRTVNATGEATLPMLGVVPSRLTRDGAEWTCELLW
ncbi:MAG: hypothetical protein ACOC9P_02845, partial [bacterium]